MLKFVELANFCDSANIDKCDGVLVVYDQGDNEEKIWTHFKTLNIPHLNIFLTNKPPRAPVTPGALHFWYQDYIESYEFVLQRCTELSRLCLSTGNELHTVGILDICEHEFPNAAWKQTVLTYTLKTKKKGDTYEEKIEQLKKEYGNDLVKNLSPLFNTWVLSKLQKLYQD